MAARTWRYYLGAGLAALAAVLPAGVAAVEFVAVLAIVVTAGCLEWGLWHWRPEHPGPWRAMQVSVLGFLVGNIVRAVGTGSTSAAADAIELASYALAAFAFWRVGAVRAYRRDPTSLIDACIAVGGLGVLVWVFLMVPYLHNDALSVAERATAVAFSLLSLTVAASIARLAIGDGVRNAAFYLLGLAGIGGVAADIVTSIGLAEDGAALSWQPVAAAAALTTVTAVSFGAAALHPKMRLLVAPATEALPSMTSLRLVGMTAAVLVAPLTLLIRNRSNLDLEAPVVVAAWVVVMVLVMVRLGGLVRSRDRAAAHDRVLGRAAERLLATSDDAADLVVGQAAVELLSPGGARAEAHVARLDDPRLEPWTADAGHAAHLAAGATVVLRGTAPVRRSPGGGAADWAAAFPLVVAGELRGALVLGADRAPTPEALAACGRLAREAALALGRAELTAEFHRRRNERRFRALVESSSDLVLQVDEGGLVTAATPAVEQLLGLTEPEVLGTRLDGLAEGADHAALAALVVAAATEGAAGPCELRLHHATRGPRWCEVHVADRRADADVGTFVVTVRGIDERKTAEERLSRSEARFRALVQHSSDVVAVLDEDRLISYVSPSVGQVLGLEAEALLDHELLALVHEDDRAGAEEALADLDPDGACPARVELRLRDGGGAWRTLDLTISDLRRHHAVQGIVLNAHDVTTRKDLEVDLALQALYDDLTGLGNRALLRQRLEAAVARRVERPGLELALLFIDLDHFKVVNDSLGHSAGDELLVMVADRLSSVTRAGDTCARLGGDEFAVLICGADRQSAVDAAERIRASLQHPFELQGRELRVNASVGISFAEDDQPDIGDLLRNSDTAMYAAKRYGKGRVVVFDPAMHVSVIEQLELMNDLGQVLVRDELVLHHQPLVELRTGRVKGFEALVRWQHPTRGLVPPGSFIPLAEESGMIVPITAWVLDEALRRLADWRRRFGDDSLMTSVNLSARHLLDEDLAGMVRGALERHGVPASALVVELTENIAVDVDSPEIRRRLHEVTDLGVRLAADDFGTGFASYANLQRLPYSVIKIDRKLIAGLADAGDSRARIQIRSIVEMAHAAEMTVVAEGVEGAEQLACLQVLHCDVGQGYYFSRPLPRAEAERLLASGRRDLLSA